MPQQTLAARLWSRVPREQIVAQWNKGNALFGDPSWFKLKPVGWGLTPTSWRGWAYAAAWAAAIGLPFALLLTRGQVPEGLVWAGASMAALVWDVRQIRRALQTPAAAPQELYYIGEDAENGPRAAARKYDLQVR